MSYLKQIIPVFLISLLGFFPCRAGEGYQEPSFLQRNWLPMLLWADHIYRSCTVIEPKHVGYKTVKEGKKTKKVPIFEPVEVFKPTKIPGVLVRMKIMDTCFSFFKTPVSVVYAPFKWAAENALGYKYRSPEYYQAPLLSSATALFWVLDFIKNGVIRSKIYGLVAAAMHAVEQKVSTTQAYKKLHAALAALGTKMGNKVMAALPAALRAKMKAQSTAPSITQNNIQHKTAQKGRKKTPNRSKVVGLPQHRKPIRPNYAHA